MWSVLGIWHSHTDIIITGIMMIQSVVPTPTLPDQDEEKLSPGLCVKIKQSIQTNHKRVRISKSKIKVLLQACLVVFPSFLLFLPCLISPLSPCRGAGPFLSLSAVPGGSPERACLLPCCGSLEENLHCKFQLKTNIHGWVMNPQRDRWWSGLKHLLFAFGSKPH